MSSRSGRRRALAACLTALLGVLGVGPSMLLGQDRGGAGHRQVEVESSTEEDERFLDELERVFLRGGSHSAQRDLDEFLEEQPSHSRARQLAARVALRRGRLSQAQQHLDSVEQADPALQAALWLRQGRYEEALELGHGSALAPLAAQRLRVAALDGMGLRQRAQAEARAVTRQPDTAGLNGRDLLDLGWLLAFERRWELANQALVFADRELNGGATSSSGLRDTEVLVELARVFQAARQTGSAGPDKTLTTLGAVLELDPGHPEALVVLARARLYGNNGQGAMEALERALATDPEHPEARVLRGEALLISRQAGRALEDAERVLAGNPRRRDALALAAAALAVTTQRERAAQAEEAFSAAHPESAAMASLMGRVLQSHYRFAESIPWLERALALEPEDEEPLPVLAQSLAHTGREADALVALQEHLRRSPFPYPWRHNMIAVLQALADETVDVLSESGFRLRLPPSEREVYGALLQERLERARADMTERWGIEPDQEVLVEVFGRHADFSVRTVGFQGFMALGACFGPVVTLVSPLSELRHQFLWSQTAVHEYAHVVTLTLSRQRMPRWLSEGISVVEERKANPTWTRPLEREVLDARANGLVMPVTRMDELFQDGSTVMLGYYLGSVICEVIEARYGFSALRELVAAYADDLSTAQAVERALGVPPDELDAAVLAYIDEDVASRAVLRPTFSEQGKERLREAAWAGDEDALFELAWAYHQTGRRSDADSALARVLETEGESPRVLRLLAERDLADGRRGQARARLETWLTTAPPEVDGLLRLADLCLQDGDRAQALDHLRAARRLFPSDVSPAGPLARLLAVLRQEGPERAEWLDVLEAVARHDVTALDSRRTLADEARKAGRPARAVDLLIQAVDIDPYAAGLRVELADLLMELGRVEEAEAQWRLLLAIRVDQAPDSDRDSLQEWQELARRRLSEGGG